MLGSQNVSCSWTTQGLGQERGLPFGRNANECVRDMEGCPQAEHVMETNTNQHIYIYSSPSPLFPLPVRSPVPFPLSLFLSLSPVAAEVNRGLLSKAHGHLL